MADFDLSLVIRGKDEGASALGQKVAQSVDKLTAAEERAALATAKRKAVEENLNSTYSTKQAALLRLTQAEERLAIAEANATAKATLMSNTLKSSRLNLTNFGQQIQDVSVGLALGVPPMTIFSQQAGQMAFSLANAGGKIGAVARIFAGPWGSAIILATALLGNFIFNSDKAAKSQEDLGDMADYVGRAQTQLGKVVDLVTGKFSNQNIVLREAIRLQAILAQQEAYKKGQALGQQLSTGGQLAAGIGGPLAGVLGAYRQVTGTGLTQDYRRLVDSYKSNANASFTQFRQSLEQMAASGKLKGIDVQQATIDALKLAVARQDYRANKDIQAVLEGREALPDYLRKTAKAKKDPKAKKGPDPFVLDEFGRDAEDRIQSLTRAFSDTPTQVDRVNQAIKQLDDLLDDIAHKKPPNMKQLLEDGEKARDIIKNGINKPFNDFILAQKDSLDVARLVAQGREDEAAALQIINKLEHEQGPLDQAHKDAVLASVQAIKEEQRQSDILREKQQKYLDLLDEVKDAVKGIIADPIKGIQDLPKKLIGAVAQLRTEKIFESLFGDTFRKLQDQITGQDTAKDAATRFATAADAAAAANKQASAAVADLAGAARGAASALRGTANAASGGDAGDLPPLTGDAANDNGAIVVTGKRAPSGLGGILQGLAKGVGISDGAAKKIGDLTGKAVGGAATGALTNSFLKPLGKALGFKTSATGAQIGGAIGAFLPIPGGDIIGSIVGSLLGGAFKTTKKGSATITSAFDVASVTGNNSAFQKAASGLAESVQGGLQQIAQSLGGTLGSFAVSVGVRHGDFRVDPTGSGKTKIKSGAIDFNDDQAAAIAFAIRDAIADGAIQGLSEAVRRALNSSPDLDKALNEALKVQQLETLIKGIGGQFSQAFQLEDAAAKERVRLAKTYGLDLAKVEQINGERRAKLLDDLLKQQLGSLQDLQKSILYGDLFEGDASTKRNALLDQITKVTKDAEAGIDGATDQLASLYQQLIGTSREAFGTAGPEYTSDRSLVTSGLDHIIGVERDRIEKAAAFQDASLAAVNDNNTLTSETNDLLAGTNARLDSLIASASYGYGLSATSGGGGGESLARYARLV